MVFRRLFLLITAAAGLALSFTLPLAVAQDTGRPFATNTPPGQAPFATNTPTQGQLKPVVTPDAALERYALRLWTEADMVRSLIEQVEQLAPGDSERETGISLLQIELERRFPGAPRRAETRAALLSAMLRAPRGSVDLRFVARPTIEGLLNEIRPPLDAFSTYSASGFGFSTTPTNLDGRSETIEAIIAVRFPADASDDSIRYRDYIPVQLTDAGRYRVINGTPPLPAAPFGAAQRISLENLKDLNQDGGAEISLTLDTGGINRLLIIYGWRGGQLGSLTTPENGIPFGEIVSWPQDDDTLTVRVLRVESPQWNCLAQQEVTWRYRSNFYRPLTLFDRFQTQPSLACRMFNLEPLFDQPRDIAISNLESLLPFAQPGDETAAQRAVIVAAMLRLLDGQRESAIQQVRQVQAMAQPGTWLAEQANAFLETAVRPGSTPLQVCAALAAASEYGGCDVDAVLARLFLDQPLRQDEPIVSQLTALGITVSSVRTVAEVGRIDRQVARFNLAGERQWAFAPLGDGIYTAERLPPPADITSALFAPAPRTLRPPQTAFDAITSGDARIALNLLDNLTREAPGVPLHPSGRFLQALAYDILGDRPKAREAYYTLWVDAPATVWGQLAAAHLERR